MYVAVLDWSGPHAGAGAQGEPGLDAVGQASEWIDSETADWFATSYLESDRGPELVDRSETRAAQLDHWFG
jgi:hypothetical protein